MPHKRVPGIPIHINGSIYLVPALTVGQYADNCDAIVETIADAKKSDPADSLRHGMPIVLMAFQRNYPETTEAELEEWLDLTTFWKVLVIALGRSQQQVQPPPEDRELYDSIAADREKALKRTRRET